MNVTIIGCGYVGLVTAACLADVGNDVCCYDVDRDKIGILESGGIPIHEPGLHEIVARNKAAGRLSFTTDAGRAMSQREAIFIAVGTPSGEDGSADLQYVLAAAREIGRHIEGFTVVVDKSTVPVGTARRVREAIAEQLAQRGVDSMFSVVSNPEFLKEGAAIEDFTRPERIVVGCDEDVPGERARDTMKRLYSPYNRNRDRMLFMDVRSAEFTKYAANAMLATRISFMNELANLAERVGADIEAVRRGIGSDPRIGYHFLYAGCGYGGSCFPKDVRALMQTAHEQGQTLHILDAVSEVNAAQKQVLVAKIVDRFGEDLTGRSFGVWGLAFKPGTDDMREAPSRVLIAALLERGARVAAFDPVAMKEAQRAFAADLRGEPDALARLTLVEDQMDVAANADALVIMTEWKAFKSPDFDSLKTRLKHPVVFDGRNLYEPAAMDELGIEYHSIGRPGSGGAQPAGTVRDALGSRTADASV
ncbi:MAG: UDP-glucose dehydrogenase family protein [Trinickia sp.]|uniref:UDP-glucose dehydrogenase family protein n=1 Tax=Trinickia sp. TaxID=2571163 RepID=UPI003F7ED488